MQPPSYFVHTDEIFDIVKRAHLTTGHGGRDKMLKALVPKYANISCDMLKLYKDLCTECLNKRKRPTTTGTVVHPIVTNEFNSRAHVDLVDMQAMPHGQY